MTSAKKEMNSKADRTDDKQSKRHPLGGGKGKENGELQLTVISQIPEQFDEQFTT